MPGGRRDTVRSGAVTPNAASRRNTVIDASMRALEARFDPRAGVWAIDAASG